jgi:invasion protein IalB
VLRCERPGTAPGAAAPPRVCEVAQTIQVQGQNAPIAQIAIGRLAKADPLRVTIVTPANVSFPSTPRIAVEEKDSQPLDLVWRRCLPGGCFADATLKEENIRRLRSRAEPGRIEFKTELAGILLSRSFSRPPASSGRARKE